MVRPQWIRCKGTRLSINCRGAEKKEQGVDSLTECLRSIRHLWASTASGGGGGASSSIFSRALSLELSECDQRRFDAVMRALLLDDNGGGVGFELFLWVIPLQMPLALDLRALRGHCTAFTPLQENAIKVIGGAAAIVDFVEQNRRRQQRRSTTDDAEDEARVSIALRCKTALGDEIVRIAKERFRSERTHHCNYKITLWLDGDRHTSAPSDEHIDNTVTKEHLHIQGMRLVVLTRSHNPSADAADDK